MAKTTTGGGARPHSPPAICAHFYSLMVATMAKTATNCVKLIPFEAIDVTLNLNTFKEYVI